MKGKLIILRTTAFMVVLLFLVMTPQTLVAVCGDANNDSAVSTTDWITIMEYLFTEGPAPPIYDNAEADGLRELTIADIAWIADCVFLECTNPPDSCTPLAEPIVPQTNPDCFMTYHPGIPPTVSAYTVGFRLTAPTDVRGLQMPLKFVIDGVPAKIDSITVSLDPGAALTLYTIDSDSTTLNLGLFSFLAIEAIDQMLFLVHISFPPALKFQQLEVQYAAYVPPHAPAEHQYEIVPMAMLPQGFREPILTASCCDFPGDANQDERTTISDAVYIVNWIFGSPPPIDCPPEMDANHSGSISITDVVYLINYIFGGGPAPLCTP